MKTGKYLNVLDLTVHNPGDSCLVPFGALGVPSALSGSLLAPFGSLWLPFRSRWLPSGPVCHTWANCCSLWPCLLAPLAPFGLGPSSSLWLPFGSPQSRDARDAVAGATRRQQDFYGTILELLIRFPRSWPHIRIYSRFFFQYVGPRRPAASRNRPNNTCTFHLPMRRLGAATYLLASVWIQC